MCVGAGYQNLRTSPAGLWSGIARTPSDRRGRVRNWCRARSRYVTHRDGSKPRSIDEVLQKVEGQTGKEGRAAFEKFLAKAMRSSRCVSWRGIKTCEHHPPAGFPVDVCRGGVSKPANIPRRLVVSETGVERDRVTLPTGMDPSHALSMR